MARKIITRQEYYTKKILCPKCNTNEQVKASAIVILTSEARDFKDGINTSWCGSCGWRGMLNELLPLPEPIVENRE